MGNTLKNNYVFQLKGTLTTAGTTVSISDDLERSLPVAFTNAYIVMRNRRGNLIERCQGTASAGTLTLSLRGLDQSDTNTEVSSLKREWTEGTVVYLTILSVQLVDKQSDNTFAGTQNFYNIYVSNNGTFAKTLRIPAFVNTAARDLAIPTPVDGMMANVGGDLQHYNGATVQWETAATGTPTPFASTTVAGTTQEATTTQVGTQVGTGSTGARLFINPTSTTKTSAGSADANKIPVLSSDGKLDSSFLDDTDITTDAIYDIDTFILGEAVTAGQSLFVENVPTFAASTSVQNVGDVTNNTRLDIPAIGTGVASNSFNLGLKKFVSPSVDFNFRIETDSAGSPSGTLINSQAVGAVTAASLTTSLVDTNVLFTGVTDTDGITFDFSGPTTDSLGYRLYTNQALRVQVVNKSATCTATRARVLTDAGVVVATATFIGNVATFASPAAIANATYFRVELDNSGGSYTYHSKTGAAFPQNKTNINYISGSVNAGFSNTAFNIDSIQTNLDLTIPLGTKVHIVAFAGTYGSETINATNYYGVGYNAVDTTTRAARTYNGSVWSSVQATKFYYTSSTLFTPKLLSLTSASFTYKLPTDIPRIAAAAGAIGANVLCTTYGMNINQSGLTAGTYYYISNTPGAISSSAGTQVYPIGVAIDSTTLFVGQKYTDVIITVLNSTSNSADTGDVTAVTDGYVTVYVNVNGASATAKATITYGAASPSATIGAIGAVDSGSAGKDAMITFPVKKGYHRRVLQAGSNSTVTTKVYFTPIAN